MSEKRGPGSAEIVTEILKKCGIPPHLKGYHYLRYAIISTYEDPDLINAITKRLYDLVGKKFNTTKSRTERAIRHALEVGANTPYGVENMNAYTGYFDGVPSNGQFIAGAVDYLYLLSNKLPVFAGQPKELKGADQ